MSEKKTDKTSELGYKNENVFAKQTDAQKKEIFDFCEDYRQFINEAKTEREFCDSTCRELAKAGFVALESKTSLKAGDRVYTVNRGKGVIAAVIGKDDISNGVNLVGAHIDSPRLDLKPNPLYEDSGFAFLKRITTAESKSISGRQCRFRFTALRLLRTELR